MVIPCLLFRRCQPNLFACTSTYRRWCRIRGSLHITEKRAWTSQDVQGKQGYCRKWSTWCCIIVLGIWSNHILVYLGQSTFCAGQGTASRFMNMKAGTAIPIQWIGQIYLILPTKAKQGSLLAQDHSPPYPFQPNPSLLSDSTHQIPHRSELPQPSDRTITGVHTTKPPRKPYF